MTDVQRIAHSSFVVSLKPRSNTRHEVAADLLNQDKLTGGYSC